MANDGLEEIRRQYKAIEAKKNKTPEDIQRVQMLLKKAKTITDLKGGGGPAAYQPFFNDVMNNTVVPYQRQRLTDYEKNIDNQITQNRKKIENANTEEEISAATEKINRLNKTKDTFIEKQKSSLKLLDAEEGNEAGRIQARTELYNSLADPKLANIYKTSAGSRGENKSIEALGNEGIEQGTRQNTFGGGTGTGTGGNIGQRESYSSETTRYSGQPRSGQEGNVDDLTDIQYGSGAGIQQKPTDVNNVDYRGTVVESQMTDPQFNYRSIGTDVPGYLIDVGRAVLGGKGAMEKVPTYEPSEMFQTYTEEAQNMRNMGLSPDELAFARTQAEKGYAYDVKNISRLAGGSAGVALGNLGRATSQLQQSYGNIAMRDEAVRRMNRQNFGQAALASEDVNRQMFQDKLSQTMMNKQAGAQLANDALQNILNRRDFERYYGKGSLSEAYKNEMLKEQSLNNQAIKSQADYYTRGSNILNSITKESESPSSINVDTQISTTSKQPELMNGVPSYRIPGEVSVSDKGFYKLEESQVENRNINGGTVNVPSPQVQDYQKQQFDLFMSDYEPKRESVRMRMNNAKVGSREYNMAKKELDDLQRQYTEFQTKIGEMTDEQIPNYK